MGVSRSVGAVIYVRVSSKEQEREGFSIPAQKKLLKEYAQKNNLRIVKVFEEAETAKSTGRKQFSEMVEFLKSNPDVNHLLVEKTDRLYRNIHDYVELDFESLGLTIHLVKESEILCKDSRSHQKFIHGIKLLMAKNYIDNLSEEVKKGQTEKAAQGIWPSNAPIGFINKLDDHTVMPDPKVAPLIAKGFELASTGQYSLSRLKKVLYDMGLRSPRAGKELGKQAMSRILKNTIYYGPFSWKNKIYQGIHKPIISKELFDKTQIAMGFTVKPRLTKRDFVFSGIMTCGHCGCSITAEQKIKKSGKSYIYYHCTNGKGSCENVTYIREEVIESAFVTALNGIQLNEEIVEYTRQALLESSSDERAFREAQLNALAERYKKLGSYIDQCYQDKLDGTIEPEQWENRTAQWKSEQSEITDRINALRDANTDYMLNGIRLMELASKASDLFGDMTTDEKRETLGLVLSNSRVVNGSVEYDYKMPFGMFLNVTDLENWRSERDSNPRPSA
jgi:site-specific DNA recombinase